MIKLNHDKKEWLKEHARRVVSDSYAEKRKEIDLQEAILFAKAHYLHLEKYPEHLLKQVYDICGNAAIGEVKMNGNYGFDKLYYMREVIPAIDGEAKNIDLIRSSLPVRDETVIIYVPVMYENYKATLAVFDDEANKLCREWQEAREEYLVNAMKEVELIHVGIAKAKTLEEVEKNIMPEAAQLRKIPELLEV